jgi:hypothetical protein
LEKINLAKEITLLKKKIDPSSQTFTKDVQRLKILK